MKKKLLLTSILSVIMCVSLIVGATFALFTSESNVNIAVTSGKVEVTAVIDNTEYKTLTKDWTAFDTTASLDVGGSISIDATNGQIVFDKVVPGDGIKFDILVNNGSNVAVKYRTSVLNETIDDKLFSALAIKVNNATYTGATISNWAELAVGTNGEKVTVEIVLPEDVDGADYMDKTCKFNVLVEAVQGNAPVVNVNANGTTTEQIVIEDAKGNSASAGAGVNLGTNSTMTLKVEELEEDQANTGNFEITAGSEVYAYDVEISEVADGNTTPIIVTMAAPANLSGVVLFHKGVAMTAVATKADVDVDGEFFYDATGSITFATTSFSNFTLVSGLEGYAFVSTADELIAALEAKNDKEVVLNNDIKIDPAKMSSGYGATGLKVYNGMTLNGNGFTIDVKGAGGTWDSGINVRGGTVKNVTISGAFRGIFIQNNDKEVILENVTTTGTVYTISVDQGANGGVRATNCKFYGWTSFAATLGDAVFENCTFAAGSGCNYSRPYANTTYIKCTFGEGHKLDPAGKVVFAECNYNGVEITADNYTDLVEPDYESSSYDNVSFAKVVYSAEELFTALMNGENVVLGGNIDLNDGGIVIG